MKKDKKIRKLEKSLKAARNMSSYWMKEYLTCSHDFATAVTEKQDAHKILGIITSYNAEVIRLLAKK